MRQDYQKNIILKELKYLEMMSQISCSCKVLNGGILKIELTNEGQKTLEENRNLWTKIKSKIRGFNIAGFGVDMR